MVNDFHTISGSLVIGFLVFVGFCRIFDDVITKNADISKNNDVINFFVLVFSECTKVAS